MESIQKILGPPGTGKTTSLIKIVKEALNNKIKPHEIAYLAFTKRAAKEAISRVKDIDFPYFRTIHSLCYSELGLSKTDIVQRKHMIELGNQLGLDIKMRGSFNEGGIWGFSTGDKIVTLENMSRVCIKPLLEVWEEDDNEIEWENLEAYNKEYRSFKKKSKLIDFSDMLELFILQKQKPSFKLLIVDEAQDLSKLQWKVINSINTSKIVVAGDDDQAIYNWSGADVNSFIDMKGETKVLNKGYRVSEKVYNLSIELSDRIEKRLDKPWLPTRFKGTINRIVDLDEIDLDPGTWLLLARNTYQLKEYEELCIRLGVPYEMQGSKKYRISLIQAILSWTAIKKEKHITGKEVNHLLKFLYHTPNLLESKKLYNLDYLTKKLNVSDKGEWFDSLTNISYDEIEFFRSALRREEDIKNPRVRISTIHGVKGAEASNVVIMTDISRKAYDKMEINSDDENRLFYVAITRTIENLYIVEPQTRYYYEI